MKLAKFPQVIQRRIGRLDLLDIKGDLVGPWAVRVHQEINSMIHKSKGALVLNLKLTETMDSLGAKAIVENLVTRERSGIIRGSSQVMDTIKAYPTKQCLNVMDDEDELVKLFGKEMAETCELVVDKRHFRRIKTALPLTFSCRDKKGNDLQFRAIITNMSEGGLFAEFLDLEDVSKSEAIINPYELSLLKLQISIPGNNPVEADGKVVHVRADGNQIGIGVEFYRIEAAPKKVIKQFIIGIEN